MFRNEYPILIKDTHSRWLHKYPCISYLQSFLVERLCRRKREKIRWRTPPYDSWLIPKLLEVSGNLEPAHCTVRSSSSVFVRHNLNQVGMKLHNLRQTIEKYESEISFEFRGWMMLNNFWIMIKLVYCEGHASRMYFMVLLSLSA